MRCFGRKAFIIFLAMAAVILTGCHYSSVEVSVYPSEITAGQTAVILVTLIVDAEPVEGVTVVLQADDDLAGEIESTLLTTDADGTARTTFTATRDLSVLPTKCKITATAEVFKNVNGSCTIEVIPP